MKNLIPYLIIIEIFVFSVFLISVQYFFNRDDPLFFHGYFSPTLLMSIGFSLYYGFIGGLSFFTFLVFIALFFYKNFPLQHIIWNFLIILITSEFRYHWQRRIRSVEAERDYFVEQIESMRKTLYFLKLSHDQMEFNYIVKPYSLREMISELKEKLLLTQGEKELAKFFLNIISKNFQIYNACIYKKQNGNFTLLASLSEEEEINENDPMVRLAIDTKTVTYIPPKMVSQSVLNKNNLNYLSIVVARTHKNLYLLTIKEMLFANLNEETLNYIYVLLQYLLEELYFIRKMNVYYNSKKIPCDFDFIKEFYKMYELKKKAQIKSSIVVFFCRNITSEMLNKINYMKRALDLVCVLNDKKIIAFLLPFSAYASAIGFSERIISEIEELKLIEIYEIKEPTPDKIFEDAEIKCKKLIKQ